MSDDEYMNFLYSKNKILKLTYKNIITYGFFTILRNRKRLNRRKHLNRHKRQTNVKPIEINIEKSNERERINEKELIRKLVLKELSKLQIYLICMPFLLNMCLGLIN